jgi:hypothetical protein
MTQPRFLTLTAFIAGAALLRLLPHPPNVAPIAAMALFGGACFASRRAAFALPLAAMLLSDLVIGLHASIPFVYGSFALVVGIGLLLRTRRTALNVAGAALAGSLLFFVVTNLGVWLVSGLYPHTAAGLGTAFLAAIPFFVHTLAGDLFFAALLFGAFALVERTFPALRELPLPAPQAG